MTLRLFIFSIFVVVVATGLTLSAPIGEVSGSISATATVTQPIGIILLPNESNDSSSQEMRFDLLSPRADGISIEINGSPDNSRRRFMGPGVTEITCPSQVGSGVSLICIIYTAN